MRVDCELFSVVSEIDYDFKAWRVMVPSAMQMPNGGHKQQVFALLISHKRDWKDYWKYQRGFWRRLSCRMWQLRWVVRFIHSRPNTYMRCLSIGWRSDSRDWSWTHRHQRKGFLGLEVTRSQNGPWIGR